MTRTIDVHTFNHRFLNHAVSFELPRKRLCRERRAHVVSRAWFLFCFAFLLSFVMPRCRCCCGNWFRLRRCLGRDLAEHIARKCRERISSLAATSHPCIAALASASCRRLMHSLRQCGCLALRIRWLWFGSTHERVVVFGFLDASVIELASFDSSRSTALVLLVDVADWSRQVTSQSDHIVHPLLLGSPDTGPAGEVVAEPLLRSLLHLGRARLLVLRRANQSGC